MSKTQLLLKHLQRGKTVSGLQAIKWWNLYRLSDAIFKLKNRGHAIETVLVKAKKQVYGKYKMI